MATEKRSKAKAGSKSKRAAKDPKAEFDRARNRLDKKKEKRDLETHWAHFWNVCPKCGGDMFEQKSLGIRYEVCRKCHGIYVDHGEAELVANHLDIPKWFEAALKRAKKPETF
jgi:acetyl-CoA carboxylase beta subunit